MIWSCKHCKYFDDSESFEGTGYCSLFYDYVSAHGQCDDFEEEE